MSPREYLRQLWRRCVQTARSTIGVPDYDAYLAHCRDRHPERAPMSYTEFFNERQVARYRGTGGRCC